MLHSSHDDAPMTPRDLMHAYAALHNGGVTSGDFNPMLALFQRDAVIEFIDIPFGPLDGIEAIAAAFANHPPHDGIVLIKITTGQDAARAVYAWQSKPELPAGTMSITIDGNRIARLVILFGCTDLLGV